ncbi:unnamed protein product [Durusdinium trenchii]|uniref:Peroxin-13 n=1 Tax=Durusdinium trenchii TaxID=1381693 RepID=A0ABP0P8G9_9DINO
MYGGGYGGMYGRSMYGGYGGGMYGGYGGYGGMYGGMYPGMMGQGMGSSYAESMWRMTQMLEMNSIMLEQLQEHVTVTFYRLRDVVEWIWALKNSSDSVKDKPPEEDAKNESKEEKDVEMSRVRRRFKALMLLLGLFMFLIFRDNRRQKKRLLDETSWLKVVQRAYHKPALIADVTAEWEKSGELSPFGKEADHGLVYCTLHDLHRAKAGLGRSSSEVKLPSVPPRRIAPVPIGGLWRWPGGPPLPADVESIITVTTASIPPSALSVLSRSSPALTKSQLAPSLPQATPPVGYHRIKTAEGSGQAPEAPGPRQRR